MEFKTTSKGYRGWFHGKGPIRVVFLHGNLTNPDERNILSQGPLTFPYPGGYVSKSQVTLVDNTDYGVSIFCPVYTAVKNRYSMAWINGMLADPDIADGSALVLAGNSYGGLATVQYYELDNNDFAAYFAFSPYLNGWDFKPSDFNNNNPIKLLIAANDNISSVPQVKKLESILKTLGRDVESEYNVGGTHYASTTTFTRPDIAKREFYDWIKAKVKTVPVTPTPGEKILGTLYKQDGKMFGEFTDGGVLPVSTGT